VLKVDGESGIPDNLSMDPAEDGVGWHLVDNKKYQSPTHSFYYGNPETGDYGTDYSNSGALYIKNVNLMPNMDYTLSFSLYMDTEQSSYYDTLSVSLIYLGESFTVWTKSSVEDFETWDKYSVDISAFAGKTVDIKFFFDTVDSFANSSEGIYLDDILIESNCVKSDFLTLIAPSMTIFIFSPKKML
jgi:hypothetical protein